MLARIATRFPARAEDFAAGLSLGSELRESDQWSTAGPCSFIERGDQRRPPSTAQRRPSAAILSPHWYSWLIESISRVRLPSRLG